VSTQRMPGEDSYSMFSPSVDRLAQPVKIEQPLGQGTPVPGAVSVVHAKGFVTGDSLVAKYRGRRSVNSASTYTIAPSPVDKSRHAGEIEHSIAVVELKRDPSVIWVRACSG
jgi:hypothetical protein